MEAAAKLFTYVEPPRYTHEEFYRIFAGQRVELIDGLVVAMSPSVPMHDSVIQRLSEHLTIALARRAKVRTQLGFIAGDAILAPDVAVVRRRDFAEQHPKHAHLIVEVADSSLKYDRDKKPELYRAAHVEEYWLVNVRARTVSVTTKLCSKLRRKPVVHRAGVIAPLAFADVRIDLQWLFSGVSK